MKTKTTTTSAKKARTGKTATTKRTLVSQKPLSRSRHVTSQAMANLSDATRAPRGLSKKATIEALVARREGAVIAELIAATGWQEHSIRAALTGLRKAGHTIARVRDDRGVTRYRIGGAA